MAVAQGWGEIYACGAEGGSDAEEQRGEHRDEQCEGEDPVIGRDIEEGHGAGTPRIEREEQLKAAGSEDGPESGAEAGEEEAFGE